ncbi:MAG: DUF4328 domain-containing protein [Mycobacterium sp.]
MIQVCAACGTRWNVRDKQRVWCPRCHGALMAPSADARVPDPNWSRPGAARPNTSAPPQRPDPRLPAGYRWIAVRPGTPPEPRRRRRPLGPTPRYAGTPQWGLRDYIDPGTGEQTAPPPSGPSTTLVRWTLVIVAAIMAFAALVHVLRYVLLVINRTYLLNPLLAGGALWLGVLASVLAIFAVIGGALVLVTWLIARRAAVFTHHGLTEPRPTWALWVGSLVPLVNLFWAPVYVIEMAMTEGVYARLRRPIIVWWLLWVLSTAVSIWALATSFATNAQGIADNTVTMTLAYVLALAAVVAVTRVYLGFERKPVERPAHRWVIVAADQRGTPESAPAVEPVGQEPAA